MKITRINFDVDPEVKKQFKAKLARDGKSIREIGNTLILNYLKQEKS